MKRLIRWYWHVRIWLNYKWLLDPRVPDWYIDERLRASGLDPKKIAREGAQLVEELLAKRKS